MDRISTHAAHAHMLSILMIQQQRVQDAQQQVASGNRYDSYQGFGFESGQLLSLETTRISIDQLAQTNTTVQNRLAITDTALSSLDTSLRDFRQQLLTAGGGDPLDPGTAKDLQDAAFRALSDLQSYLNTEADGRYVFSGSRVTTKPVDLGLTSLDDFQARYDGLQTQFPPTRDADLSANVTLTTAETGGLVISGTNTISAADPSLTPPPFSQVPVGATISLDGSSLGNSGSYTVVSKPSDYAIVVSGSLTLSANATLDVQATLNDGNEDPGATLSLNKWYNGDTQSSTLQVDAQRTETFDLNAIDPAFEKAIRAAGLIAEGAPDTDGGLANHSERIGWAIDLLNSALDQVPSQPPPFGPEQSGNLTDVRSELGFQQSLLNDTTEQQNTFVSTLQTRISKMADADVNEAATALLDSNQALQAAYSAIASVNKLSLVDFLPPP